jgi:4'-phosphopantetheinyl transferase
MAGLELMVASVVVAGDARGIRVWQIDAERIVAAERERMWSSLDAQEQSRARRLVHQRDRQRYVAFHGAVRAILSLELGTTAGSIRFTRGTFGKPALVGGALAFNLAHSEGLGLLGLLESGEIGIDLESMADARDLELVARTHFAAREQAEWLALPAGERAAAFFRVWTRKEALLKAEGRGLFRPLDSFEVSLGSPPRLVATRPDSTEADRWILLEPEVPAGFAAAVAVDRRVAPIITRHCFPPSS